MNLQKLQEKLHNEIPLTKIMGIRVCKIKDNKLITKAPLDININDKGTAFGGSLSTMSIISGWGMCYLLADKLNISNSNIVIIENETSFKKPVTKDFSCFTKIPSSDEIEILKAKLDKKGSASIKIYSTIEENNQCCVDFIGYYVIKL